MSKYFTKYLPVEGEIKEGDTVAWDCNNNLLVGITGTQNSIKTLKDDGYQSAKLFLCSRDIEIGDRLYPLEGAEDQHEGAEMTCLQDVVVFKKNKAFKVIGEISREATWVKEGDEFDKDEIYLSGHGPNWNDETPLSGKSIAFIKGPCGHFH